MTGFQESQREGVWRSRRRTLGEYDPATDRLLVVREKVYVLRASCTRAQLAVFRRGGGEELLLEMGRSLNQEAVAYETREGLTILSV